MSLAATRLTVLAGTALLSLPAWADVPGALDRVPTDAVMVFAIRDLDQFHARFTKLLKDLNVDPGAKGDDKFAMALSLVDTPGINRKGSAAMALMPDNKAKAAEANKAGEDAMEEEPSEGPGPMVMIIPVTDYAAFVKAFGGEAAGANIVELTGPKDSDAFSGPMFAKDIGGGYAAMGPMKDVVETFDGSAGRMAEHTRTLGIVGGRIADKADTVIVTNIAAVTPKVRDGFTQMKQKAEMVLTMAGDAAKGAEGMMKVADVAVENFLRDAQVGVMGLGLDDGGVWMDLGAQFKEGSETGKLFQGKGKAAALTGRLPDQPFLLSFALDTSLPGIKQMVKNLAKMTAPAPGTPLADAPNTMADFAKTIDTVNGYAMVLGTSPGMMSGGLFANAAVYCSTNDPAAYTRVMKDSMTAINGKTIGGMTYKSTYEPGAATISGVKVDKWSSQMTIDPNAPTAMQAQQVQMMLFGASGGPGGFVATVDKGVVMTMSQNTPLMTSALESAVGKNSLGQNAELKGAAEKLPADRTLEAFIGVRAIIDMVSGFVPGLAEKAPAKIPPIAIGAVTSDSGTHLRIYVPTEVIATVASFSKGMGADEPAEDEMEPPAEDGKPPRF